MNTGIKHQDARSMRELKDVHPTLGAFVADMSQGFQLVVTDGLRTAKEQAEMVILGASLTTNSKHLRQADGFSHAVDIALMLHGKIRWEEPLYYELALQAQAWCQKTKAQLRWGGCWHNLLMHDFWHDVADVETSVQKYVTSKRQRGRRALVDCPHFELVS
jgi:peptidoglycan L-alanyl-D-glutamate endopeptidase CwlK